MKIKTFTYKRILNLGNYESKHLEATIEVETYLLDSAEEECSALMEMVERKIREDCATKIKDEIRSAREELWAIQKEIEVAKQQLVPHTEEVREA
ncbi:hypothetical protein A0J48_025910, partial [Sphaerospermopsis aphanizomenoides BCCUSP55]|uniref:hypothetical protein n=1 Tax=Sphaerospermopsis aphanizomenoides TaxID=459663 RepID=UPI0019067619